MEFRDWYSEENWLWFASEYSHIDETWYYMSPHYTSKIAWLKDYRKSPSEHCDNIANARERAVIRHCKNQNMPVPWCDIVELERIDIQEDELVYKNPWMMDNLGLSSRDVLLNFIMANASFYVKELCDSEYKEVWVEVGVLKHPGYAKFYKTYTRFTLKDLKEIALWVHGKFPTLPE